MPIDQAKERLLSQNLKAKSGPDAEKLYSTSMHLISDASSGRMKGVTVR